MPRISNKSKLSADWADPKTSADLPVDPKKLSELRTWLENNRGKPGILVISGPTGSAKTASLRVIAKELGFDVSEWITPLDRNFSKPSDAGPDAFLNATDLFDDFLYSSSRYSSLFARARSQLVLVEDYPNTFLRQPFLFHDVLRRYREFARSPAVFICTEVADRSLKLLTDLFPSSVQLKLGLSHISFNAVCRTKMLTAVKRMCQLLQKLQPGLTSVNADTCEEITNESNGDVRYAMLAVQMGLKKSNSDLSLFNNAMKRKPKDSESEAVKNSGKDEKVGLLQAVGRVLYPKYEASSKKSLGKRKRKGTTSSSESKEGSGFVHSPDCVADSYSSSASMFVLFIQENYLNTFSSIKSIAEASAILSESDVMMTAEGVETSHDITFYITLNGVMCANKAPTRSWNPIRRPRILDSTVDLQGLSKMLPQSISLRCLNTSTLMTDFVSYLPMLPNSNLTLDQRLFLESLCPMTSDSSKNSLKPIKSWSQEPHSSAKINRKDPELEELHISDSSDSEAEKDIQETHISDGDIDDDDLVAAVIAAEKEINYEAMLMDCCDDDLLLASQNC